MATYKIVVPKPAAKDESGATTGLYAVDEMVTPSAEWQQKIMDTVCAVPIFQNLQLWAWNSSLDLGVDVKGSLNLSPPVTEKAYFKN